MIKHINGTSLGPVNVLCDGCKKIPRGLSQFDDSEQAQDWLDGELSPIPDNCWNTVDSDKIFHFTNGGRIYCADCVEKLIAGSKVYA